MSQTMCPLCHSDSAPRSVHTGENREYWLCGRCRLIFVPPRHHVSAETEKSHYLKHENSLENEGYVRMFEKKIAIIQAHCPGVRSILDYGCGYAPVLKTLLARKGYRATGYDPYFFPDTDLTARFDCIVSTETFEHFKHPGRELADLTARLAPGGFLAIMTRFYPADGEGFSLADFASWYYKRDPTHIAYYGSATFRWIAAAFDLCIVYNDGVDFIILQRPPR